MNRKSTLVFAGLALVATAGIGLLPDGLRNTGQQATGEALAAEAAASELPAQKQVTLVFTVNNIGFLGTCG